MYIIITHVIIIHVHVMVRAREILCRDKGMVLERKIREK